MTDRKLELIAFDLDGTLIDSAPSILSCFEKVLEAAGIAPRVPLEESLIGPPLTQTLRTLTGIEEDAELAVLAEAFKHQYDSTGYLESRPYPDIAEQLLELRSHGYRLALATNKRIKPTRLILNHLGWSELFSSVAALDAFQPRLPHKTAMLGALLQLESISSGLTIYVGDKIEDAQAAEANGMHFAAACWGYGDFETSGTLRMQFRNPSELARLTQFDRRET